MNDIAKRVDDILRDSFFKDDEEIKDAVLVDGITQGFGLHPVRLESHREELKEVLREMNPTFLKGTGDGWSFLNLAEDKNGRQWGEHRNCEQLFILCNGLGMANYCLPREMWESLPGGVPYIVFDPDGRKAQ